MTRPTTHLAGTLILAAIAAAAPTHADVSQSPVVSPGWRAIEGRLGSVWPDGTLRRHFELAASRQAVLLGLRCTLEHRLDVDAYGRPCSRWVIPALHTSLAPDGRGQLMWRRFDGSAMRFPRPGVGPALERTGNSGWLVRQPVAGSYDIRALDGRAFQYLAGLLVAASHPQLGEFRVTTRGALVTGIHPVPVEGVPVVEARYDDAGQCTLVRFGCDPPHQFAWDAAGRLIRWERPDASVVRFAYDAGLISRILAPGQLPEIYRWEQDSAFGRGDSPWRSPARVMEDSTHSYDYSVTSRGLAVRVLDRRSGERALSVFNPRRGRLKQLWAGGGVVAVFAAREGDARRLVRIESVDGEPLEDYRHDPVTGVLTAVKRRGEREWVLIRDATGRLMTQKAAEP